MSQSLAMVTFAHFRLLDLVLPVTRWVHRISWISDGRLINIYIWRHPLLAASTARTSMDAKEVMASAGSGKLRFSTDGTICSVAVQRLRLYGIRCPFVQIRSSALTNAPFLSGLGSFRFQKTLPIHQT